MKRFFCAPFASFASFAAAGWFICGAPAAHAQDLHDLLRNGGGGGHPAAPMGGQIGIGQPGNVQEIIETIRSVSTPRFGSLTGDMQAPAGADGSVVLYRTASCPPSKQAAAYMQSKGIPFVERDVERNAEYNKEYQRLGGRGVPFMVFGRKTPTGYSPAMIDRNYADMQRAGRDEPSAEQGQGQGQGRGLGQGQAGGRDDGGRPTRAAGNRRNPDAGGRGAANPELDGPGNDRAEMNGSGGYGNGNGNGSRNDPSGSGAGKNANDGTDRRMMGRWPPSR